MKRINKKYLAGSLTIVFLVAVVFAGVLAIRQRVFNSASASSLVNLDLTSPATVKPGDIFYVTVYAATNGNKLSGADVTVQIDSNFFTVSGVSAGEFLPEVFRAPSYTTSTISIAVGSVPGLPVTGTGTLFTIALKAKTKLGSTTIKLSPSSVATVIGQPANAAGGFKAVTVSIQSATPTSKPTPTPNVTPVISTTSLVNGRVNRPYSALITVYDPDPGSTVTINSPTVPAWINNVTCTVSVTASRKTYNCTYSGTPSQVGTYNMTITAIDEIGEKVSKAFKIVIGK